MPPNKNNPGAAAEPKVQINPTILGRAIWRATVLHEKKPMSKEQRLAQWQADREEYRKLGRKVFQQIKAMLRERKAAAGKKQ